MHTRRNTKYLMIAATAALLIAPFGLRTASADLTTTFDPNSFATDISYNAAASFADTGVGGTGPLAFDPNNPDTLFIVNRAASTPTGGGGAFPFSISTQHRISNTAGPIFLGSTLLGITWTSVSEPYDAVVGNDGSLYLEFVGTAAVYKVANPLSDTPAVTKILGNYNLSGDDDPQGLFRMPASFGAAGYTSNDLIVLDDGLDANNVNAVVAVHADGSDGTAPKIIWKSPGATPSTTSIHGAVDPNSGFVYFISTATQQTSIDGTNYVYLSRVKGDGILQTIGLKLPTGVTLANSDDPIAVNPVDGSVWLAESITLNGSTTARNMLRVDTNYLTATSDSNTFLANTTLEFTATTGFNLGVNSLTFTNDGKELYAGTPDGTDKIYVFNTLIHNPGDANGDGVVNADDYALIDRGFAADLTGFTNGDFNSDGVIDMNDYLIIDTAYLQTHPMDPSLLAERSAQFGDSYVSSLLASVPEPSSALLLLASFPLIQRRKRNALS
ncbi:MAG TPA: dockerin type I repeat-containing protein [Tepidisphaeraceae bacterium]|jgi:hypothetical protein|nr:dockerin type I repeat-containing protein [Tepidisphaeraceae bacterium]